MGERSILQGDQTPFPPQNCLFPAAATTRLLQRLCWTPVTDWSLNRSDALTQCNKIPPSYIHNHGKMESWVSDLLLCLNPLDDFPLACTLLDFPTTFIPQLQRRKNTFTERKENAKPINQYRMKSTGKLLCSITKFAEGIFCWNVKLVSYIVAWQWIILLWLWISYLVYKAGE